MPERPSPEEAAARVDERDDLVDRIAGGDLAALEELIEDATGAEIVRTEVTLPRHASRPAAG